jgi:chemotaxis protein MotB
MKYLLVFLLITTGCVSSGRYKEDTGSLTDQLNAAKAANVDAQKKIDDDKKQIGDLQDKLISSTKDKGHLQASLDDMKKALEEMNTRRAAEEKRIKEFQDLTARFKKLTDSGALSVKIVDGKMVVSLGSDVLFSPGSSKLSREGNAAIKEVATQLAAIDGKHFQVEGHTDNKPISTAAFPSNWELASARALSVLKKMIDNGMPANRVSAASYADTQPAQSNDTTEGRSANRRIAIVVVPDLSELPGYDELQKYAQ